MKKFYLTTALLLVISTGTTLALDEDTDIDPSSCFTPAYYMSTTRTKSSSATTYTQAQSTDANTQGEVSNLQAFLKETNYLAQSVTTTGRYGPATQAAVKRLQAQYGLTQTGATGPLTRAKIQELSCNEEEGGNTSTIPPTPTVTIKNSGGTTVTQAGKDDTVTISWATGGTVTKYYVKVGDPGSSNTPSELDLNTTTSWTGTLTQLGLPEGSRTLQAKACNTYGCSSYSPIATLRVGNGQASTPHTCVVGSQTGVTVAQIRAQDPNATQDFTKKFATLSPSACYLSTGKTGVSTGPTVIESNGDMYYFSSTGVVKQGGTSTGSTSDTSGGGAGVPVITELTVTPYLHNFAILSWKVNNAPTSCTYIPERSVEAVVSEVLPNNKGKYNKVVGVDFSSADKAGNRISFDYVFDSNNPGKVLDYLNPNYMPKESNFVFSLVCSNAYGTSTKATVTIHPSEFTKAYKKFLTNRLSEPMLSDAGNQLFQISYINRDLEQAQIEQNKKAFDSNGLPVVGEINKTVPGYVLGEDIYTYLFGGQNLKICTTKFTFKIFSTESTPCSKDSDFIYLKDAGTWVYEDKNPYLTHLPLNTMSKYWIGYLNNGVGVRRHGHPLWTTSSDVAEYHNSNGYYVFKREDGMTGYFSITMGGALFKFTP